MSRKPVWALLGLLLLPTLAVAQEAVARDGLFVTVPNPIRDEAVQQIKQKVKDAVERQRRTIQTVVFDFNPDGLPAGSSNFGSCSDLADYIRNLRLGAAHPGVRPNTVAFVHNEVSRHTVLPVLACNQIVMALGTDEQKNPRARLGDVTKGLTEPLTETARDAYRRLAESYPSPDLILRLLDPSLVLKRVETAQGVRYASPERIEKWRSEGKALAVKSEVPPGIEVGRASYDPETARAIGLSSAFYDTRADLAAALQLPRQSLSENWLVGRQVVPWRLDVVGPIDKARLDSLRRRLNTAVGRGANLVFLHLDSSGGETAHVAALAQELRQLKDRSGVYPVKLVAYVPPGRALGAACFLAVACDEIVMGTESALADFTYLRGEKADALQARREMLLPLVRAQGYPEPLFRASLERNLTLVRVRAKADPADERLLTEEQYQADQASLSPEWHALGRIAPPAGEPFVIITAPLAKEWHVAQTDIDTPAALYAAYDVAPDQVRVSRDDFLDRIAEFFREPWVNFLLITVGVLCLILELKMPGVSLPGAIAAVCFVLFFWAYSFVGEFTLLAVMLFLLGLVLLGVEIFILPGFGFCGLSGVALLLTSLALVTLERWPETSRDWMDLGATLSLFAMSLAAAIIAAFIAASFLPSIPYANRLVLQPPGEEEGVVDVPGTALIDPALLGAIGVAATTLRPSGKAQFGDEFLDVIAEGDYVSPGSRVQVVEIEGNRVVVKEV